MGKTTLLRLLADLLRATSGAVTLAELDRRRVAQRLAFVAQHLDMTDRISVRDAVELGRTPRLTALQPWSDADDRIVAEALAAVGLQGFGNRDWITLSGGERQRVHIAPALAQTPEILTHDELTNHLDIHHQLSILRMVADLGRATIIALHDLNHALHCDLLGVRHRGRLIALGSPSAVLTPGLLRAVFAVRASGLIDPADRARVLRFQSLA